jgi:hypothetical protein
VHTDVELQDTDVSAPLLSICASGDHEPLNVAISPHPSAIRQNDAPVHVTERSSPLGSAMPADLHDVPPKRYALPAGSVAMQNRAVGHESETSAERASTTTGAAHDVPSNSTTDPDWSEAAQNVGVAHETAISAVESMVTSGVQDAPSNVVARPYWSTATHEVGAVQATFSNGCAPLSILVAVDHVPELNSATLPATSPAMQKLTVGHEIEPS